MKILNKINAIFLGIFLIFSSYAAAADRILPVPRPASDEFVKKIIAKKNIILPKKKPKKKDENEQESQVQEVVKSTDENKKEVFIYPEKKPIIVKKSIDKIVKKSSVLSKKDFQIAKSVFEAIDKKKWDTAFKLSKKARDKSLYKLVGYLYLKKLVMLQVFMIINHL